MSIDAAITDAVTVAVAPVLAELRALWNGGNSAAVNSGDASLPCPSGNAACVQPSPERLVKQLSEAIAGTDSSPGAKAKSALPLGDLPSLALGSISAPGDAILGSLADLSSIGKVASPWRQWAALCHWSCQRCTERLGFLLTGQVRATLPELAREVPGLRLGTLTISPPPGIRLGELRDAVDRVVGENSGHAIWAMKIPPTGHAFAYILATATDSKQLERSARPAVRGDSRSAKFTLLRGSAGSWLQPGEVFEFNIGRVLRHLVRACSAPPTLRPGYRFGASGLFAPVLANALAILRREHPCRAVGHDRMPKQAREISPEASDGEPRTCRWCDLPVFGRAWRHPHCSTRRWRANLALRSELGPEAFDGFQYQVADMVHVGVREPEAMRRAFGEFAGRGASLPPGLLEVLTLPREIVPPGRRPARFLRMPKTPHRRRP